MALALGLSCLWVNWCLEQLEAGHGALTPAAPVVAMAVVAVRARQLLQTLALSLHLRLPRPNAVVLVQGLAVPVLVVQLVVVVKPQSHPPGAGWTVVQVEQQPTCLVVTTKIRAARALDELLLQLLWKPGLVSHLQLLHGHQASPRASLTRPNGGCRATLLLRQRKAVAVGLASANLLLPRTPVGWLSQYTLTPCLSSCGAACKCLLPTWKAWMHQAALSWLNTRLLWHLRLRCSTKLLLSSVRPAASLSL